jgi:hypothetical protein
MKNIDLNKLWIGVIAGLIAPSVTLWLYYIINYRKLTIAHFIDYLRLGNTYTPLISLCVLANLAVFYPFIWKEKWSAAKGVIGATFIWATLVLFLKFFT